MDHPVKENGLLPPGPWPLPPNPDKQPVQAEAYQDAIVSYAGEICDLELNDQHSLLQVLIKIHYRYGWIPIYAQQQICLKLGVSIGEVRSVISFYSFISAEFLGQYRIQLSSNVTDLFLSQQDNLKAFEKALNIESEGLSRDHKVSLTNTSCTGLCDQGPAALINGYAIAKLDKDKIIKIADFIERGVPFERWPEHWFIPESNIQRADLLLDHPYCYGDALSRWQKADPKELLNEIEISRLRGRGGAGYSTYQKLVAVRDASEKSRPVIVCNADEGEPGTFKDRVLLQEHFPKVVEGMVLAALMLNAAKGFLYLRGEYVYLYDHLNHQLQNLKKSQWLKSSFDIEIHLGAGAYACGEESALIESLEGKRGIPRIRPPFPATQGYQGYPTLVNNVETFACITQIALKGGDNFSQHGTPESTGTKLHSISGDCRNPGIYELPWGISVEEVLELCGANNTVAVQIGGPAGILLPKSQFDRKLAFEDLASGGSFMVFDQTRDLVDIVSNFTAFFRHESCGFCTPCRTGCVQLDQICKQMLAKRLNQRDLDNTRNLTALMSQLSHCGLGKTAGLPIKSLLEHWPEIVDGAKSGDQMSFDIEAATSKSRSLGKESS